MYRPNNNKIVVGKYELSVYSLIYYYHDFARWEIPISSIPIWSLLIYTSINLIWIILENIWLNLSAGYSRFTNNYTKFQSLENQVTQPLLKVGLLPLISYQMWASLYMTVQNHANMFTYFLKRNIFTYLSFLLNVRKTRNLSLDFSLYFSFSKLRQG